MFTASQDVDALIVYINWESNVANEMEFEFSE
jgi:hypothetical protein